MGSVQACSFALMLCPSCSAKLVKDYLALLGKYLSMMLYLDSKFSSQNSKEVYSHVCKTTCIQLLKRITDPSTCRIISFLNWGTSYAKTNTNFAICLWLVARNTHDQVTYCLFTTNVFYSPQKTVFYRVPVKFLHGYVIG